MLQVLASDVSHRPMTGSTVNSRARRSVPPGADRCRSGAGVHYTAHGTTAPQQQPEHGRVFGGRIHRSVLEAFMLTAVILGGSFCRLAATRVRGHERDSTLTLPPCHAEVLRASTRNMINYVWFGNPQPNRSKHDQLRLVW